MWTTYGSYNRLEKPVVDDAIIIVAYDTLYSFFAGISMFAVVGYLDHEKFPVKEENGPDLAYIGMPSAIAMETENPEIWSCILFGVWFIFALDT